MTTLTKSVKCFKNVFLLSLVLSALLLIISWNFIDFRLTGDNKALLARVKNTICNVSLTDYRPNINNKTDLVMIYFVTPTYHRPEQIPELIRLSHTLMHVQKIHWIVADDHASCSAMVLNILKKSGLPFTHLSSPNPFRSTKGNSPRGVANRRAALSWLHENRQSIIEGVVYFGDDDNTVDLELFDEIRLTKKVSMFPVGLIGNYGISTPIVRKGKVKAFFDSWPGKRMFPVDMAGFAINIKLLKPNVIMPYREGFEEDSFLTHLNISLNDIEPLANNCTKILVWHTRTRKNPVHNLKINMNELENKGWTDFVLLLNEVNSMGMAHLDPHHGQKVVIIKNRETFYDLSLIDN